MGAHAAPPAAATFMLWRPGVLDALRRFLLAENFQSAVQLAVGILFVSIFVFVERLRFPSSCVAVLLYIVVAVTAAPDNHVGTRIFLAGFMIGPMWIALITGGVVASLALLCPTRQGHMVVMCVLGPLTLIPFCINRVGTSHLYLWAMGMVSALYVGLPLMGGFSAPSMRILWANAVGFVFVAAIIAMFAGSVLSMLVLPSLASHKLEDDVCGALRMLGHHLGNTASNLFRSTPPQETARLQHLRDLHPLLLQQQRSSEPIAPGLALLDQETPAHVGHHEVYLAVMDWFEHMSRPPGDPDSGLRRRCLTACATPGGSAGSDSEARAKTTFFGPHAVRELSVTAAAVAAAIADSIDDSWTDASPSGATGMAASLSGAAGGSGGGALPLSARHSASISKEAAWSAAQQQQHQQQQQQQQQVPDGDGAAAGEPPAERTGSQRHLRSRSLARSLSRIDSLRLGSKLTVAALEASKSKSAASAKPARGVPVVPAAAAAAGAAGAPPSKADATSSLPSSMGGASAASLPRGRVLMQPVPSIADVRQLLAHAFQLQDAAKCEPQWLRGSSRRYHAPAWAKVIAQSQLLALRLSALDLLYREHMVLLDASHSFPMDAEMQGVVGFIYGSAAAALALIADELADRDNRRGSSGGRAAARVLQGPKWQSCKDELIACVERSLCNYWQRIVTATPDQPITVPRSHWVRAWMFFMLVTLSIVDVTNSLGDAVTEALATPKRARRLSVRRMGGSTVPAAAGTGTPAAAAAEAAQQQDVEAGTAAAEPAADVAAGPPGSGGMGQQQQQQQAAGAGASPFSQHAQQQPLSVEAQQQPGAAGPGSAAAGAGAAGAAAGTRPTRPARLKASLQQHTAWIQPWLPLALNVAQWQHVRRTLSQDLPAMLSSKQAFVRQLKGRRFQAGVKYWIVCTTVLVSVLAILYAVPAAARHAPNFAYSAAAVGMSDRVESTVHKVVFWTVSSVLGALIGWSLMAHPNLANNPYALAAALCAVAAFVGGLGRSRNSLVTFYTLMTIASVVLCQYVGCLPCGATGSAMTAIVRGGSVSAAAAFAVAFQNLVLPWHTSTWALEQMGDAYQHAADVLLRLVCELYVSTVDLMQQGGAGADGSDACTGSGAARRLQQLDDAVQAAQARLQQQGSAPPATLGRLPDVCALAVGSGGAAAGPAGAASLAASLRAAASTAASGAVAAAAAAAPAAASPQPSATAGSGKAGAAAGSAGPGAGSSAASVNLLALLQQRHVLPGTAPGGGETVCTPGFLQAQLVRPLVNVKISLLLDTTTWRTGLFATPSVVTRLLASMFELADTLGALQQAISVRVTRLSGSWDWMLMHTSQVWAELLLCVLQVADAAAAHLHEPTAASAAALLQRLQELQHHRFEFFTHNNAVRRLLHVAVASDASLYPALLSDMHSHLEIQGHMRYSSCVYAVGKVMDSITAVARCALEVGDKLRELPSTPGSAAGGRGPSAWQ